MLKMSYPKLKARIKQIPEKPGVYWFKDKTGRILYMGKAVNLRNRVRSHFSTRGNSPQPPLILRGGKEKIADIDWIETDNEKQAYLLENELIKKYKPRYNIQWRDDKSYFWVVFTNEEWPRVHVVHQIALRHSERRQESLTNAGRKPVARFFTSFRMTTPLGPFVNGQELKKTLRALRKIFPFRTCKNHYNKPCLQWHLGLCPAHKISSEFRPKTKNYQLKTYQNSLNALAQFLRLYASEPIRIEAYDISNIQGRHATGSMIVFEGSRPKKQDYRRFRIKTVWGANDAAMIKEMLKRRLRHAEWPYPDLILIDGGRPQLNAAKSEIKNLKIEIPFIALAKQKEELYTEFSDKTLGLISLPSRLKLIFQAIRDEAHRFALFYYRHLHRRHLSCRPARQIVELDKKDAK